MNVPRPAEAPPPTCWSCGYELTGLRVEDDCPECGFAIWSSAIVIHSGKSDVLNDALNARRLGVAAIIISVPFGPASLIAAIPAIIVGRRALGKWHSANVLPRGLRIARIGVNLGWLAVGLSSAWIITLFLL